MNSVSMTQEKPVKADQVAEFLGIGRATVMNMAREGRIPAHPITGGGKRKRWSFYLSEIDRYVRQKGVVDSAGNPCAI